MLTARRQLLLAAYAVVLLGPVTIVFVGGNPGNSSMATLFAVSIGWTALSALVLQVVLSSRMRLLAGPFGADLLIRFHRQMGLVAFGLVAAHVVILLIDNPERLDEVLKRSPGYLLGVLALVALAAIVITSWPRTRGLRTHEAWRLVHGALAFILVAATFAHVLVTGHHTMSPMVRWIAFGLLVLAAVSLFVLRVGRPYLHMRRPYRLQDVIPERGATTLRLVDRSGERAPFQPGQFAWIKLAHGPFSLSEHPFSYSSSVYDPALSLTVKGAGDFTSRIRSLPIGTELLVDGPHGSFRPALPHDGYILVAAGSGIGPAMSIIRTVRDSRDQRALTLVYGTRSFEDATFFEELTGLANEGRLELVWVVSQPPPGWSGHGGRIRPEVLREVLPPDLMHRNVFVCGPGTMVDTALWSLEQFGVSPWHIHGERF